MFCRLKSILKKTKWHDVKNGSELFLFFLLTFFYFFTFAESQESPVIKLLEIKGNKKIEEKTIKDKMKSKEGAIFSKSNVQKDIKSIYKMGYFDDVRVEIEPFEGGVKLIFIIKEKPTITSIDVQGIKRVKRAEITEKLTIVPGAISNYQLIFENTKIVKDYYRSKGFWHVEVTPVVRVISEDAVALTFHVNEGEKVLIKKIKIHGNKALKDKEIKKVMRTKEKSLLSFLTGTGFYHKELLEADIQSIRLLYHDHGYLNVAISEPVVKLKDKKIFIELYITEGSQYRVGAFKFSGNDFFSKDALLHQIETDTGKVFNRSGLKKDIAKMLDLYTQKGYAMADINPLIKVDKERLIVDIDLIFTEGDIFNVGRINISGNYKTRDKVIRREILFDEGARYNSQLVEKSREKIMNLQFFDTVDIKSDVQEEARLINFDVNVMERLTGMISLGGGYSSRDKILGMAEITETNLFGRGLYLKLKGELSRNTLNYDLKIVNPWLFDRPISGSIAVYNESFKYPSYDSTRRGGAVGLGRQFTENMTGSVTYTLERVRINNVDDGASFFIREQEGTFTSSKIGIALLRDSRNNVVDPTSGSKNGIFANLAGLGGNRKYHKFLLDSGWFIPFKWDTAFFFRGRFGNAAGYSGRELPINERFYVGGINTIRGVDFGEAGPRDENGEIIGGDMEIIFNAEYIFPLIETLRLKGVVFFDAGSAYIRSNLDIIDQATRTTGLGVRWISPFGLVRLEWGHNLSKRKDQESNRFEFAFGSSL